MRKLHPFISDKFENKGCIVTHKLKDIAMLNKLALIAKNLGIVIIELTKALWNDFTHVDEKSSSTDDGLHTFHDLHDFEVNPATSLPMIQGSNIDVQGNPFGTDIKTFK